MISHSIESIVSSSGKLIIVALRIKQIVINVMIFLIFILVASYVFLNVILHAWFNHIVLINSDILTLARALLIGVVFLYILVRFRAVLRIIALLLCSNIYMWLLTDWALMGSLTAMGLPMSCPDILRLLMMYLTWSMSMTSLTLPLALVLSCGCSTTLTLSILCWCWWLLLARVELIANSTVLHTRANDVRKSIVVAMNLQRIRNDRLNSVVVPHHFHLLYHAERRVSRTWRVTLRKNFVIVSGDEKVGYGVASANLDLAVVASKNNAFTWLHQGHTHAVVWNINWVINTSTTAWLLLRWSSMMIASWSTTIRLSKLNITILHSWGTSRLLTKSISELLVEI